MEPGKFHHDFASQLNLAMRQYSSMGFLHQQFQHIKMEPTDVNQFRFYNANDPNAAPKQEPRTEDEEDDMSSISPSPPTQPGSQHPMGGPLPHHPGDNKIPQPLIPNPNMNHPSQQQQQQMQQQQVAAHQQQQQQQHQQNPMEQLKG
uniref:Uncharacterized protein n=1 Tax=Cacopsylla melanoneura TaxID=428564 RepID=A0A8D9DSH1_9HEMI